MIDNPLNRLNVKRGSDLPHAKPSDDDVRNIRALIEHREDLKRQASALSGPRLAEKFGVHPRTIDRISQGETWGHL